MAAKQEETNNPVVYFSYTNSDKDLVKRVQDILMNLPLRYTDSQNVEDGQLEIKQREHLISAATWVVILFTDDYRRTMELEEGIIADIARAKKRKNVVYLLKSNFPFFETPKYFDCIFVDLQNFADSLSCVVLRVPGLLKGSICTSQGHLDVSHEMLCFECMTQRRTRSAPEYSDTTKWNTLPLMSLEGVYMNIRRKNLILFPPGNSLSRTLQTKKVNQEDQDVNDKQMYLDGPTRTSLSKNKMDAFPVWARKMLFVLSWLYYSVRRFIGYI